MNRPRPARPLAPITAPLTALVAVLSLAGCASTAPPAPVDPRYQGLWRTEGYGYFADIGDTSTRLFHLTDSVCVEIPDDAQGLHAYLGHFQPPLLDGGQLFRFGDPEDSWGIPVRRTDDWPAVCRQPTPDTPLGNFTAFASFFDTHYAFFDLYGVDWPAAVAAARARIHPDMDDDALFAEFQALLSPLDDGHVSMSATIDGKTREFEAGEGATLSRLRELAARDKVRFDRYAQQYLERHWLEHVGDTLLGGDGELAGEDLIQYGMLDEGVGYLGLLTMAGFAGEDASGFEMAGVELPAFEQAIDDAMAHFERAGARALVIDLSVNFGGYDLIGRRLASRFASAPTFVYDKRPADDPDAGDFAIGIEASPRPGFDGPIYLLTSDVTVSAGETTSLALRALPQVTHAGTATRGALSDVLNKTLPNGWTLTLSNEIYRDVEGVIWEGRGIEPQLPIPVFDPQDPAHGHGEAIEQLLAHIRAQGEG